MRYGGHETFSVREGWLHKGLTLAANEPDKLTDTWAPDWLGVGGNMAKSIRHWLLAFGLCERASKSAPFAPTALGRMILKTDPYFVDMGTWWILHVNITHSRKYSLSWSWMFNDLTLEKFSRDTFFELLNRHVSVGENRPPSHKTLERDAACLLATYARSIPHKEKDPEEAYTSPFVNLGILDYFANGRTYKINKGIKDVPLEIYAYCLSKSFEHVATGDYVSIFDATTKLNSPGKTFALGLEANFEMVNRLASESNEIELQSYAGERRIRLNPKTPDKWLIQHFEKVGKGVHNAA